MQDSGQPNQPSADSANGAGRKPRHGELWKLAFSERVAMEFVFVDAPAVSPHGFLMGSPLNEPGRAHDEAQHRVIITRPYWIQTTPVTQEQWRLLMRDNPSYFQDMDNLPVEGINWRDTYRFCETLSQYGLQARLPSEAEWEFAARAGSRAAYRTGDTITPQDANFNGQYVTSSGRRKGEFRMRTTPVDLFPPNRLGLRDTAGNVWEWCLDWYDRYPAQPEEDPRGPRTGSNRVLRGGSWVNGPHECRVSSRYQVAPAVRGINLGFRIVLEHAG
jgi:sulfatase modifying factor 1